MTRSPLRVAVGGLNQESNAFTPIPAGRSDFIEIPPAKMRRAFEGTSTEIAGFLERAEAGGHAVAPVGFAWAETGGLLPADDAEGLVNDVVAAVVEASPDVVLLALHGSMAAQGIDDVEGLFLGKVRAELGPDVVVGATLDWHATVSADMVQHADLLAAYRTYPHIDQRPRAETLAGLALAAAAGEVRPTPGWCHPPLLIAGPQTGHEAAPMADLLAEIEQVMTDAPGVLDWSLCPGYARCDVPAAGVHTYVVTDDAPDRADELAARVADMVWHRRERFAPDVSTVEAAMVALRHASGPVVLSDQGDNPGGGAAGDSVELLAALLHEIASHPEVYEEAHPVVVCGLAAPRAVDAAVRAGLGSAVALELGPAHEPIRVDATVEYLGSGDYVMRSPTHDGVRRRIGPTATVAIGPVRVILTSTRVQNEDLQMLEAAGVDPRRARALVVKSNAHFRAAFGPLADLVIDVDTSGLSTPRLERLPFRRIDRPAYPLDIDVEWRPPS